MRNIMGTTAFTIGFASLVTLAALVWIFERKEASTETKHLEKSINGVSAVGVQYDKDQIFLNVHTDKKLNCAEVFQVLDIGPIIVKNNVYLPECNVINEKLIEIVFKSKAMQ